jgi:hypothetical protein
MFPQTEDPKGDHQKWSEEEMRAWLNNVSLNQANRESHSRLAINQSCRETCNQPAKRRGRN